MEELDCSRRMVSFTSLAAQALDHVEQRKKMPKEPFYANFVINTASWRSTHGKNKDLEKLIGTRQERPPADQTTSLYHNAKDHISTIVASCTGKVTACKTPEAFCFLII